MDEIHVRPATSADLPAIVDMLADDPLGAARETPDDLTPYRAAFDELDRDRRQLIGVADAGGQAVGVLQLTILVGLARTAMTRGHIEGVRTHRDFRGKGVGRALMRWAIEESRTRGCGLVELTSDATRVDAHRFYEELGFEHSHYAFKLNLHQK